MSGVLLVCHANTCRSVMAHALLERMLAERGADGASASARPASSPYARDGMLASLDARLVLRRSASISPRTTIASTDLQTPPGPARRGRTWS